MDDFAFQSAVNLVKAIQDRIISSSELLEICIERYERHNPSINAIVEVDFETARVKARQADEALSNNENWGPLHGLPMTIKDYIFAVVKIVLFQIVIFRIVRGVFIFKEELMSMKPRITLF